MQIFKHLLLAIGYGFLGVIATLLIVYGTHLQNRPELELWHTVELDEEFTTGKAESIQSFEEYLDLEERLFRQLRRHVYQDNDKAGKNLLNRYYAGSRADPTNVEPNWNRSFELKIENPRGGVLLVHGLSDSPYSMRALAELLHAQGFYVLGLRLPGHGTAPVGLVHASWQDFAAATRLAAHHTRQQIGENKPFYLAGYSTGAALVVEYSLAILEGEVLPAADGLVLISPAIGVTPIAVLAKYQAKLAAIPGLEKFAWDPIQPEYNPYKYQSFAVNAGDQIYRLTRRIEQHINSLDKGEGVTGMPPILAFQSVVDATVSTKALVKVLFKRLVSEGHELVLFDIDRSAHMEPFLAYDPVDDIKQLFADPQLPFTTTLLTNVSSDSQEIYARHRFAGPSKVAGEQLELIWPDDIYSLSHTALPFSPDDPVNGAKAPQDRKLVYLGRKDLRGERGLFIVPATELLRLSYNPFYSYLEKRVVDFLKQSERTQLKE
jgi:alpha-beta hydrolase superfamily lysophospholipase